MIQIISQEIKEGMVLGKSIYRDNGELLLASGYTINDKVLPKILELEQPSYWIQDKDTEAILPEEMISDQIALQGREAIRNNLDLIRKTAKTQEDTIDSIRKTMADSKKFKNIPEKLNLKNVMI